jgi:photosystem II stability/assembly factor-like uncharacterized protein
MKKLNLVVLLTVVFCYSAKAYEHWVVKNLADYGTFYGVAATDAEHAYLVGASGSIRKTSDGGNSWLKLTSGVSNNLLAISFPSETTGYVVGTGGKILKTTNAGSTWEALTSGVTDSLTSICFVDALTGYVVGGKSGNASTILKTTDGGVNWEKQTAGVSGCLRSVFFVDALVGYACGYAGIILKTTDGGNSWATLTSGYSGTFHAVCFTDSNNGYVAGSSGAIFKTTDGGTTWTKKSTPTTRDLYGLAASGPYVYAVGQVGTVLRSKNGTVWELQYVPVSVGYELNSVAFMENAGPIAVGALEAVVKQETVAASNNLVYVPCSRDNTLIESSNGSLSNGIGALYVGRTNQGTGVSKRRGLVYFDVASYVPSNATIDSVKVGLFILTPSLGDAKNAKIYFYRLTSDWGEGTSYFDGGRGTTATTNDATWLHTNYPSKTWNNAGGDFVSDTTALMTFGYMCGTASSIQMKSDVQNWLNAVYSNYGWIMKSDELNAGTAIQIKSKDTGPIPQLEVYYSITTALQTAVSPKTTFTVYPNPASEWVQIQFQSETTETIRVYNISGTIVKTAECSQASNVSIPVSDLASGMYVVKVGSAVSKLLIK